MTQPMPTDLEIARDTKLRPIQEVAADMGVPSEYVELRGREMAKISLDAIAAMGALGNELGSMFNTVADNLESAQQ